MRGEPFLDCQLSPTNVPVLSMSKVLLRQK